MIYRKNSDKFPDFKDVETKHEELDGENKKVRYRKLHVISLFLFFIFLVCIQQENMRIVVIMAAGI